MTTPFELAFYRRLMSDSFLKDVARPGRNVLEVQSFWYGAEFDGLHASANSQSDLIETQADSDFVCTAISARARVFATQAFDAMPLVWVQVTDQASGKTFFNAPLITRIVAGDFGMPMRLPVPRVILPNSTLQIDVQPVDTRYDAMWITLGGSRIFYEAVQ